MLLAFTSAGLKLAPQCCSRSCPAGLKPCPTCLLRSHPPLKPGPASAANHLSGGWALVMIDPSRHGYPCSAAARAAALRRRVPDCQPARGAGSLPVLAPAAPRPADLARTSSALLRIDPLSRG